MALEEDQEDRRKLLIPELPSGVIISGILTRLEIKDVGRARSVCKEWNTATKDSNFINEHLNRSSQHLLLQTYSQFAVVKDVDLINNRGDPLNPKDVSIGSQRPWDMCIVGSCNGLLCLINRRNQNTIYIYNPITKEASELPNLLVCKEDYYHDGIGSVGFGFDPFNNKYKVFVELYREQYDHHNHYQCNCKIITVGESSWRTLNHPESESTRSLYDYKEKAVFFHGFFHWVFSKKMVLSLDICNEKFKKLEISSSIQHYSNGEFTIRNLGETLALVPKGYQHRVKMWQINGSEFHEQEFHALTGSSDFVHALLGKLSDGSYLFQQSPDRCLVLYVSDKKQVCMENVDGISRRNCKAISFVPSLLSPRALTTGR